MSGRVVIVTGAGGAIGAAMCKKLSADGAIVIGCDLPGKLASIPSEASLALACDVASANDCTTVAAQTLRRFGRIDSLVANAGIMRIGSVEGSSWADIESVFNVNLFGVIHCIRAVMPAMRAQGHGRIVATVSRNAQLHRPDRMSYNASKAAVVSVIGTLASEIGVADILVNGALPGPTESGMHSTPGARAPDTAYPTFKTLLTLPAGGPNGRTFFDMEEYDILRRLPDEEHHSLVSALDAKRT